MRIIILLCLLISLGAGAQSVRMKITGVTPTAGEAVLAFELSDTLPMVIGSSGGGSGNTHWEYAKIKKLNDKSTRELLKRSIDGSHSDVTFEFYDSTNTLFYTLVLKVAFVTHFSFLSPECAGCGKLYHEVWFAFLKLEVTDGVNGTPPLKWDISTNQFYN